MRPPSPSRLQFVVLHRPVADFQTDSAKQAGGWYNRRPLDRHVREWW
jgi:hypothetical protein